MSRKYLLTAAVIWGTLSLTCPAFSEMFLAIGLPQGDPSNGWVAGWDATEAGALNLCRGLAVATNKDDMLKALKSPNVSKAQQACKTIGDLNNQCFAIASNGTPTTSASAIGWDIATSGDDAKTGAMAHCNAMRSNDASECVLRNFRCDGAN
jgi:hypothetical protein